MEKEFCTPSSMPCLAPALTPVLFRHICRMHAEGKSLWALLMLNEYRDGTDPLMEMMAERMGKFLLEHLKDEDSKKYIPQLVRGDQLAKLPIEDAEMLKRISAHKMSVNLFGKSTVASDRRVLCPRRGMRPIKPEVYTKYSEALPTLVGIRQRGRGSMTKYRAKRSPSLIRRRRNDVLFPAPRLSHKPSVNQ